MTDTAFSPGQIWRREGPQRAVRVVARSADGTGWQIEVFDFQVKDDGRETHRRRHIRKGYVRGEDPLAPWRDYAGWRLVEGAR